MGLRHISINAKFSRFPFTFIMRHPKIKTPVYTWSNFRSPEVTSWGMMQENNLVTHSEEGAKTFEKLEIYI